MDKKIVAAVFERAGNRCEFCGAGCCGELHHIIFGSGRRRVCERYETVVHLCYECHRGIYGVHGKKGKDTNRKLKEELQSYYLQYMTEDDARERMGGKLYLENGEIVRGLKCRWMDNPNTLNTGINENS